jgi:hypothetical protein
LERVRKILEKNNHIKMSTLFRIMALRKRQVTLASQGRQIEYCPMPLAKEPVRE